MQPFCFSVPGFASDLDSALRRVNAFKFAHELGQGSLGRVQHAECPATRECFAVKRVRLPASAEKRVTILQRVAREAAAARVLSSVSPHPTGVVRHFACLYDNSTDEVLFVMQLCKGPCLAELRQKEGMAGRLPEARVRRLVGGVTVALGQLHAAGLLCVDLKAENVVLDASEEDPDRVVLLDLDLCRDLPGYDNCEAAVAAVRTAACTAVAAAPGSRTAPTTGVTAATSQPASERTIWGTAEYLAYELLQDGPAAYSPASDWWALGVLSYELLYGRPPYMGATLEALLMRMAHHTPAFPPPADGGPQVSPSMQQWVRALLRCRPDMRLGSRGGVGEVLGHPAMQGVV
ncbi:hypothetical protein Agub_g15017 [Astrephomene gubernaculifera]|uniref:non-specific serine/threonine protein kinase n=1 Tax=Astrephomene gubernaculifera TaxID=47775 RepID=A0AAD3HTD9_9CHLO|nr:hypothetical protein Agub_g15017 [Astrephomene gubernaculifera]